MDWRQTKMQYPTALVRNATIGLAYRYRWIEKASAGSSKLLPTLLILFLRQCHSSPVDSDHECQVCGHAAVSAFPLGQLDLIQMLQPLTLIHWMLLKLPLLLFSGSTKIGDGDQEPILDPKPPCLSFRFVYPRS
ncbi:hypothetical protein QYF36_026062 [Acer negundo]|nr:hypothetical protein QYF36_026062 [Acer negundo]